MTKKQKEEMLEVFSEAFHDVVVPVLEDMNEKMATKEDIDRLERRHFAIQARMDRQGKVIEKHDKEIKQVKTKLSLV